MYFCFTCCDHEFGQMRLKQRQDCHINICGHASLDFKAWSPVEN